MCIYLLGCQILGSILQEDTILDGEFVYHIQLKRHVFLIFDILAVNGRSLIGDLFSIRLDCINKDVYPKLEPYMTGVYSRAAAVKDHLIVNKKVYFEKSNIGDLLSCIHSQGGGKVYMDDKKQLNYRNHRY